MFSIDSLIFAPKYYNQGAMIQIRCSEEIKQACPEFKGIALEAMVTNTPYSEELWQEIGRFTEEYRAKFTVDSIKEMPSIQATRTAYKRCGKDPSRYRPSGEALCRRLLRGLELYKVDTVVDLINLVSIASGYSIKAAEKYKLVKAGIFRSGIWNAICTELQAAYDAEVESLRDGLLFYLQYSGQQQSTGVGYTVDYSLSIADRVTLVKEYYVVTYDDPYERMEKFKLDGVAPSYLCEGYAPLYQWFLYDVTEH